MRLLVDANNLMFALAEVAIDADRAELARRLSEFAHREGVQVTAVFDGSPTHRRGGQTAREADVEAQLGITILYSHSRQADEVLAELVDRDFSPRQLMVVSSDRQVQRYAHRRRCKVVDALEFARALKHHPSKPEPAEPKAKTEGLSAGQVDQWLKEFGLNLIEENGEIDNVDCER